jgi:hypothetical protein
MKIMLAVPTYDGKIGIKSAFEFASLSLVLQKLDIGLELAQVSGCAIVSKARNLLVTQFMKSDCTHLLFVDADVNWTASNVLQLVGKNKDIVSGLYPSRVEGKGVFLQVHEAQTDTGLLRVLAVGAGFMLIARYVLQAMMDKRPELAYKDGDQTHYALFDCAVRDAKYIGEDYNFCHRAVENGFNIFVDQANVLGHIGVKEYMVGT